MELRGFLERAGEAIKRRIECRVALGEAEAHDRADRIIGVERLDRDRGDLMLEHKALAESLIVLVQS